MFKLRNVKTFNEKDDCVCKTPHKKRRNALIGIACMTIGYVVGYRVCDIKTNAGLNAVFQTDPSVKEHMAEAISKTMRNNLMAIK